MKKKNKILKIMIKKWMNKIKIIVFFIIKRIMKIFFILKVLKATDRILILIHQNIIFLKIFKYSIKKKNYKVEKCLIVNIYFIYVIHTFVNIYIKIMTKIIQIFNFFAMNNKDLFMRSYVYPFESYPFYSK